MSCDKCLQAIEKGVVLIVDGPVNHWPDISKGEGESWKRRCAARGKRRAQRSSGDVQSVTRCCSWALTPLVGCPSALHTLCRSLFINVLERLISAGAIW